MTTTILRARCVHRQAARRAGIAWRVVWALYQQIKIREVETRAHANDVRETAWVSMTARSPGCWPFWRHGFVSRFGRIAERHDFSYIPNYDGLAQEIATQFPEYAGDDGCERLWEFLLSPYNKMPTRETMLASAIDKAEQLKARGELDAPQTPISGDHDNEF